MSFFYHFYPNSKVDKLLKTNCEASGEYCNFHRRFLSVLERIPSVSNYDLWSQKKLGYIAQNVKLEWIKDTVWDKLGTSINDIPTAEEFLTEYEKYDFEKFFSDQLEFIDQEEISDQEKDDDDFLNLDERFSSLERFYNALKDYSEKPDAMIKDKSSESDACTEIKDYMTLSWFTELYDGPNLNLGNILSQALPESDIISTFESSVAQLNSQCYSDDIVSTDLKAKLKDLKSFIDLKKFEDGFSSRKENPSFCKPTIRSTSNKCMCECHKEDKVAIYSIFAAIEMIRKDVEVTRFGDVYTYFYYNAFHQHPEGIASTSTYPLVKKSLGNEINSFEREVFKELR